jgi:hypothetical protein
MGFVGRATFQVITYGDASNLTALQKKNISIQVDTTFCSFLVEK